jgi:hypothetical protein
MKHKLVTKSILGVSLLVFGVGCEKSPPLAATTLAELTNHSAVVASATPQSVTEFAKLKGKWERPDGGYVLEIRDVAADGKADAGYFNPSPINVERTQIYSEAGAMKVFVILRDVNYPGCTYKLTYDAKVDQLHGQYFQASMQETYDVVFARLK